MTCIMVPADITAQDKINGKVLRVSNRLFPQSKVCAVSVSLAGVAARATCHRMDLLNETGTLPSQVFQALCDLEVFGDDVCGTKARSIHPDLEKARVQS